MEIILKEIDQSNWRECCHLKIASGQENFVAPNSYSLAQASYEPDCYPMGIFRDNKMLGFLMYDLETETGNWWMTRLMIDKNFQKEGIGSCAIKELIKLVVAKRGHIKFNDYIQRSAIRL